MILEDVCLDMDQMHELTELGLKLNSSLFYFQQHIFYEDIFGIVPTHGVDQYPKTLSNTEMMELLPEMLEVTPPGNHFGLRIIKNIYHRYDKWHVEYMDEHSAYLGSCAPLLRDALFQMLKELLKENLLHKQESEEQK